MKKTSIVPAGLIPAACYIRMSSDKQELSPEQQRAELAKLAAKHGCQVVEEYIDEAISGFESGKKRPDFLRLVDDAQHGKFKVVLCWDQDRFSRFDPVKFFHYCHILREAGVRIITHAQGELDFDSIAGWLTAGVNQHAKHVYLIDLSRNVVRARNRCAANGAWCGPAPFGYSRGFYDEAGTLQHVAEAGYHKPKKTWTTRLVPNEGADVVRMVFDLYRAKRCSVRHIVKQLIKSGVPTPDGEAVWSHTSIGRMLRNVAYCGDTSQGRYKTGKFSRIEPCVVQDTHEPLIGREHFDEVQAMLGATCWARINRGDAPYPLSSILRCGHCGKPVSGRTLRHKQSGTIYRYYTCSNNACKQRSARAEVVEAKILELLQEEVLSLDNLNAIKAEIQRQAAASNKADGTEARAVSITKQLAKLNKQIERATQNVLQMEQAAVAVASKQIASLIAQRDGLQTELAGADKPAAGPVDAEEAIQVLHDLREQAASGDPLILRDAMTRVFSRITLWWKTSGRRHRLIRGQAELSELAPSPR